MQWPFARAYRVRLPRLQQEPGTPVLQHKAGLRRNQPGTEVPGIALDQRYLVAIAIHDSKVVVSLASRASWSFSTEGRTSHCAVCDQLRALLA